MVIFEYVLILLIDMLKCFSAKYYHSYHSWPYVECDVMEEL